MFRQACLTLSNFFHSSTSSFILCPLGTEFLGEKDLSGERPSAVDIERTRENEII